MTTGEVHLIVAYILSLALLWGYAAWIWCGWRSVAKRENRQS